MNLFSAIIMAATTATDKCGNATDPNSSGLISSASLPQTCANHDTLNHIFIIVFTIIGGVAFLFLVIGGARYTLSQGNAESIQKAKNTIQYSLIGLIIVATAAAIVNFVIGRLG